jgi:glycosyltransferase involved in cell wall biosynthesis
MKLLLAFTDLSGGGGRTFACHLSRAFGSRIALYSLRRKHKTAQFASSLGTTTGSPFSMAMLKVSAIRVISNSQITALLLCIPFAGRHFYVTHGLANGIERQPRLRQFLFRAQLLLPGTIFVACGDSERDKLISLGAKQSKVLLVRNAVQADDVHFAPRSPDGKTKILFLGRICYQKGIDLLLEALNKLPESFHCTIAGDNQTGEERFAAEVERHIHALGSRVRRIPSIAISVDYLSQFDVCVLPSRFEGLPYLLLELAAMRMPLIASDCPGNIDVVRSNNFGGSFKTGNSDDLAKALLSFARSSPEDRANKSERLLRLTKAEFKYDDFIDSYAKILGL